MAFYATKGSIELNPEIPKDYEISSAKIQVEDALGNIIEYSITELIEMRDKRIQMLVDNGDEPIVRSVFMRHLHQQLVIALTQKLENSTEFTGHVISIK